MDLLHIPQILEQLQNELASLQAEVRRLQASQTGQAKRITMADAENLLGVSRFHIRRLIGVDIIQSGQRIGSGKNAKWTFDYQEILHLVNNPSYLNIEPVS